MRKFNVLKFVQFILVVIILWEGMSFLNFVSKENIMEKQRLQAIHESEIQKLEEENQKHVQKLVQYETKLQENNDKLNYVSIECANLENTIKQLAFVGNKPKNYKIADKIDRGSFIELYDKLKYVGEFLGTYYAPTKEECGNNKGLTASGKPVTAGHTIAVDKRYWKLGTLFYLEGYGVCEGIDTGRDILGKERLDYCVFSEDISHSGNFKVNVWLIKN
jgi:3D (Asp-Asp-Asp) domain-containing protein